MKESPPTCITPGDAHWPRRLTERLGASEPLQLFVLGNLDLLALPKTTLFCSARALPQRIPPDWNKPLADGRLLILSCFSESERRVTADLAARRNEFVAALADEVWFAHITPGGQMEQLAKRFSL